MGNRATVIFVAGDRISPAIYLHWNGGPESVYAFLAELDRRGVRSDAEYEAARFCQLVGEFFDLSGTPSRGGLSLGVTNGPDEITAEALGRVGTDHGDNGFYVVDRTATPMRVRRYTETSNQYPHPDCEGKGCDGCYQGTVYKFPLVERPDSWVERERFMAAVDAYREQFREFYADLDTTVGATEEVSI